MAVKVTRITGKDIPKYINDLANLRIEVFREFPYLYDGSIEYEQEYLNNYAYTPGCIIVIAFDDNKVIGASTGMPMEHEEANIRQPWEDGAHHVSKIFYYGESVLQKNYRGRGIGSQFFEEREKWVRQLGGFKTICFCSVVRPEDHPLRPKHYVPLDKFWEKKGFRKMEDYICKISWPDIDDNKSTEKPLVFWKKDI